MSRLSLRWLNLLVGLLALVTLNCRYDEREARERAQQEWKRNEEIVVRASALEPVDRDRFEEARAFFLELTGISVPVDHSQEVGWYPTRKTGVVIAPLRHWYADHKDELYWDQEDQMVYLRSRKR